MNLYPGRMIVFRTQTTGTSGSRLLKFKLKNYKENSKIVDAQKERVKVQSLCLLVSDKTKCKPLLHNSTWLQVGSLILKSTRRMIALMSSIKFTVQLWVKSLPICLIISVRRLITSERSSHPRFSPLMSVWRQSSNNQIDHRFRILSLKWSVTSSIVSFKMNTVNMADSIWLNRSVSSLLCYPRSFTAASSMRSPALTTPSKIQCKSVSKSTSCLKRLTTSSRWASQWRLMKTKSISSWAWDKFPTLSDSLQWHIHKLILSQRKMKSKNKTV